VKKAKLEINVCGKKHKAKLSYFYFAMILAVIPIYMGELKYLLETSSTSYLEHYIFQILGKCTSLSFFYKRPFLPPEEIIFDFLH
jgi:hypothetical protein